MARYYEEKTRTFTQKELVKMTCDLCGKERPRQQLDSWSPDPYGILETEIKMKIGASYPEGGHAVEHYVDICPDCFQGKLLPWLAKQNVKIETKETDW